MSSFQYLLPLVSVIVGLSITDVARSLHRLLRARRRVQWDWLPLATAVLSVLAVLEVWWAFYNSQQSDFFITLGGFLPFAAQLVTLFLLNAAALPDEVPAEGLDLREFYETHSSNFWILYAVYLLFASGFRVAGVLASGGVGVLDIALMVALFMVPVALFVTLSRVRWRPLHIGAVVVMFLLVLPGLVSMRLN